MCFCMMASARWHTTHDNKHAPTKKHIRTLAPVLAVNTVKKCASRASFVDLRSAPHKLITTRSCTVMRKTIHNLSKTTLILILAAGGAAAVGAGSVQGLLLLGTVFAEVGAVGVDGQAVRETDRAEVKRRVAGLKERSSP